MLVTAALPEKGREPEDYEDAFEDAKPLLEPVLPSPRAEDFPVLPHPGLPG